MSTPAALLQQIRTTLGSLAPSLSNASDASDIFEAYVFSLVLEAARVEGASVEYRDVDNGTPSMFVFRTSPGYIFSRTQRYTHALLLFMGKPALEVHVGVRVVGKSGVLHECDVAVIEHAEAETCRRQQVPPRSGKVLVAIECKFYSTSLQLQLARAFLGLAADLSTKNPMFVTNRSSEVLEKLLSGRSRNWELRLKCYVCVTNFRRFFSISKQLIKFDSNLRGLVITPAEP